MLFAVRPASAAADRADFDQRFSSTVHPFLETYCVDCHNPEKKKGDLDLSPLKKMDAAIQDDERLRLVLDKLQAGDMPPKKAKSQPSPAARQEVVGWIEQVRLWEAEKNAGDPGLVLARRLSNEEYNYTIRDLTGVDLRPTREFPVDPSNTAGFDNSGESLTMSPALLNKYIQAAREVADHMYLKRAGFAFAPHPMRVETDRDQFCVHQIIDFYRKQSTNYADYFQTAWRFKHRAALGRADTTLADFAADAGVSAKYLRTVWALLETDEESVGPVVQLRALWRGLPAPTSDQMDPARAGCVAMSDYVARVRGKVEPRFMNVAVGRIDSARQPFLVWKNVQYATHRMSFDPDQLQVEGEVKTARDGSREPGTSNVFGPGKTLLLTNAPGDPDLRVPAGRQADYEAAFGRFCKVFPDMFYMSERGRNYFDRKTDRGRYLSAGYHNLMGYFRDDQPLYELVLDAKQQAELDEMWRELDFVALANVRTYVQFYLTGGKREGLEVVEGEKIPQAHPAEGEISSEAKIKEMEQRYLTLAQGGSEVGIQAIKDYFKGMNDGIRWVEKARVEAEPGHLAALLDFAERAYRRPLAAGERQDLLAFYKEAREKDGLDHETAVREAIVSVLMSPDFCYRVDLLEAARGTQPLSDYDLASRLSYFLWSSAPDDELLKHAAAGDLHQPAVVSAQAKRMLQDPRAHALAMEFGGNWLDFRHFGEINTVDLTRYPTFTPALREAMMEEPVRFIQDAFQTNRPILDLIYAKDTLVNPILAKHYGMPVPAGADDTWVRVPDADRYDRGGLLPMAVFLTKNAPGLRTSPVKRGNWVVRNVLGEKIPPPPPVVPELPHDEAKMDLPLRDMLARHRANPTCAACHARFDALGLVFEGFGPAGERRTKDLAGRPVDASASFPNNGGDGTGLAGLRQYIQSHRQNDFVDNFCNKLLAYAFGRTLMLSDDPLLAGMQTRLAKDNYRIDDVVDSIVTSEQFLTKRGRDGLAEK